MANLNYNLSELNPEQLQAVKHTEGGVLVSAGAGSGKTRVLTHRIAHIINSGLAKKDQILAVTFTNKAAKEMRERIGKMIGEVPPIGCTFHSLCVRILRRHIDLVGYTKNFSIYDEQDKKNTIKKIIKSMNLDADKDIVKSCLQSISNAKSFGLDIQKDSELVVKVASEYEKILKANNALDFDDLLIVAHDLLRDHEEARNYYKNLYKYVLVDEFQDTNAIQLNLLKLLVGEHGNIFCVGDEDQSIYGWRGADSDNLNKICKWFGCTHYKLEQNYRSRQEILDAANRIIEHNSGRAHNHKKLWTDNPNKGTVKAIEVYDQNEEASIVVDAILKGKDKGEPFSSFAILTRLNALMLPIEKKLIEYGIPYKVFGGFKFFERKEIKDLIAYLKIISNPRDNEAILRVINFPKRGVGDSSVEKLLDIVADTGGLLFDRIVGIADDPTIPKALANKIAPFGRLVKEMAEYAVSANAYEVTRFVIQKLELEKVFSDGSEEGDTRLLNIGDFLSGVDEYTKTNPNATLDGYLQNISLYSDLDEMDNGDYVTLATVHSAKGLEWDTVFVVGVEERIFPIERSSSETDLEEERRLMYVAITRAKERLCLTHARERFRYNQREFCLPSRFLSEAGLESKSESKRYGFDGGGHGQGRLGQAAVKPIQILQPRYPSSLPKPKLDITYGPATKSTPTVKADAGKYAVGTRVRHRKFGEGTIMAITGSGDSIHGQISFESIGILNLSLNYAPLEII